MGSLGPPPSSPARFTIPTVTLSDDEFRTEQTSDESLAAAIYHLHTSGFLILRNAVAPAHIAHLNAILAPEALALARKPSTHFNGESAAGANISQSPPAREEVMYDDVWANAHVLAVLSALLGPNPVCTFVRGNTALPGGTQRQGVHADAVFNYPRFPFGAVVNIYLRGADEATGATEVWPGSHAVSSWDMHKPSWSRIQDHHLDARRATRPPVRATVQAGDVLIRDLRLWHAGVPNPDPAAEPRVMLAFVYFPAWYRNALRVPLPAKTRHVVERWERERGARFQVEWLEGREDGDLSDWRFDGDFSSRNEALQRLIPWSENPVKGAWSLNTPAYKGE